MSEELEGEVSETETFVLVEPPRLIGLDELPQSPKSTFKVATACGWEVRAALSIGEVAPTLYVGNTDEHSAGDVKYDGYVARMFTVQARDLSIDLGFRAHYLGKVYADGRKAGAGSFDSALVTDPVGVPRELHADYKPIKQLRGKYETASSFMRRQNAAKAVADEMAATYNEGMYVFEGAAFFAVAGEFDSWLAEWRSFTEKVKPNA